MASKQMLVVLAVVAAVLPAFTTATEFIVGDINGWGLGVNYADWAKDKEFKVGDTLVFNYALEDHNVIKVGGQDFHACNVPTTSEPLTTGNDVVTLTSPGRKWYICGVPSHCEGGQKLVITVQSDLQAPAIAPVPNSSFKISRSVFQNLMVAVLAMVMTIMIWS